MFEFAHTVTYSKCTKHEDDGDERECHVIIIVVVIVCMDICIILATTMCIIVGILILV